MAIFKIKETVSLVDKKMDTLGKRGKPMYFTDTQLVDAKSKYTDYDFEEVEINHSLPKGQKAYKAIKKSTTEENSLDETLEYNDYTGEWEEIETETCIWCEEEFPIEELRKELNLGYLCSRCASAIWSRGEKLTFEESKSIKDNSDTFVVRLNTRSGYNLASLTQSFDNYKAALNYAKEDEDLAWAIDRNGNCVATGGYGSRVKYHTNWRPNRKNESKSIKTFGAKANKLNEGNMKSAFADNIDKNILNTLAAGIPEEPITGYLVKCSDSASANALYYVNQGEDVTFNLGNIKLPFKQITHCWITHNGEVLQTRNDKYPDDLITKFSIELVPNDVNKAISDIKNLVNSINDTNESLSESTDFVSIKAQKYKSYYIVADPAGDGYNIYNMSNELEDEGYGTLADAQKFIDTLDESLDVVGYPTNSMSFDELTKLIKRNLDSDFISLAYNGQAGAGKCNLTFTRIDGAWARTNKNGEPLNRNTVNEINSLKLSNSEVFKELIYCLKNNDVFNLTLGCESVEELTETLKEGRLNGSYDKTQLEADLLAIKDIDKLDWDLSAYDDLGEVIVLTHRAFEDSTDMSTYYMQRTNLLREILKVFDKNNLKLVDPIEDQGTWWYFVLEHTNQPVTTDEPVFEYMMVEFFETSGTPADDIMQRTKDVKYTDLSKLSEILVNADKVFRDVDEYGGCNKVYFDNYIRYQGKLYKFHAGRVDIGDGPAEVTIPANYPEQVIDYFLDEFKSGIDIPVVEE